MTPDPWCKAERHGGERIDYRRGCRCTLARAAEAAYSRKRRSLRMTGYPGEVDATGTRRRLRALAVMGWNSVDIAAKLGITKQCVEQWRKRETAVFTTTHRRIAALYDELSMIPGPSPISRKRAIGEGWAPPLAWDDDNIDDPTALPSGIPAGRYEACDIEDVELVAASNDPWETAAARLGTNRDALERRLHRAGRRDLIARFYRNSEQWSLHDPRNQWSA